MMMFKAFMRKQWGLISMVSMMIVMLLLSTQVFMTYQFKHETMSQRVVNTNSPQVMVHVHNRFYVRYLEEAVRWYNEQVEFEHLKVSLEETVVLNTSMNNFKLLYEVLTPTLKHSLPLIEGKPLSELQADEAAIMPSYASELRKQGIDPLTHTLTLETINGDLTFKIVSIVDYPNYNDPYIHDNGLKTIPLFDFPYPSAALILEDQVKDVLYIEESSSFFGQESKTINFASGISSAFHLRFDNYSLENERILMNFMYRNLGYIPDAITFYPLYEYSDYLSTNEQLYSMITRYGLVGLSLLSALGLVVLLRQQFLQNIKSLGLLITLGHSYLKVSFILISRFIFAWLLGLGIWIGINALISPLFEYNQELSKIIDQTSLIIVMSASVVSVLFLLWMSISGYFSVRSLKYAHSSLKHQRKNTISLFPIKKHWKVNVAIKGLASRLSFTTLMILMSGLILSSATSFILISHQVSNIYNKTTLGIQFDYIVLDAPFKHYEITNDIAKSQVWVQKFSNYLFVDVHYSKNYFNYYKSSVLFFMANMEGYVTPIEGTLPEDLRNTFREWKYDIRETMASRKQMEKTNSFIYSVENVSKYKSAERGYLFLSAINPTQSNRETAAQIKGTMNTLIDQGWIAYVYRDQLMVEVAVPYLEMYLFNLDEGVSASEAEALMNEHNIQYMAFDEITTILNEVNKETQRQTLSFILLAVGLLLSLLLVVLSVYFKTMSLEQASNEKLLNQLGLKQATLKQIKVTQIGFVLSSGALISSLLLPILFQFMHDDMLQAYGLYTTIPLPVWMYSVLIFLTGILILSFSFIYQIYRPKQI
jgi:hypothetical protein